MNVHLLQHVPFEDPAHISSWLHLNSISSSTTLLYDSPHFPNLNRVQGLIILGGPMSVHDTQTYPWLAPEEHFIREAILAGIPTLGICLGAQLIAEILGAKITPGRCKEIGWFPVQHTTPNTTNPFTTLLPDQFTPFHWHGETFSLPPNALHLASSPACKYQAFSYQSHVLALQFHLETTPDSARKLLHHCPQDLTPGPYTQHPSDILGNPNRFLQAHALMDRILTTLFKPPTP